MENNQTLELLQQIESNSRRQLRLARLRCVFSFLTAMCCVAVVVIVMTALPQVGELIGRMQTTLNNLETAAAELSSVDLEGMVSNVDSLVTTGRETLSQTAGKLEELDIETLNRAIEDLAAVVEPLARLFR